ncbi:hypothetical protein [Phaeodactylibacter xiamenensis]|uniref:hypothetical protein n=1 Tax=Phaeodactylibacter xiamenensis TaxID=1524460 RepID=UPI003CCBBC90
MPLRILLILLVLSSASLLPAQEETFNKRYYFGYAAAIINGVYPTDSCIYITGLAADTIPPFYPSGLFFAKLDLNGEVEHTAFAHPEGQIITNWGGGLKPYGDGFLTSAMKRDTGARASLLFLDSMGYIDHTIELHSFFPPHEQSFLTTYEPIVGPNGMILLPTRDRNAQGINNTETVLQLFSASGELLWRKNFGIFDFWDAPESVQSVGDHFIIGGSRTNSNRVRKNYTGQHHIYAIDTLGNVQWSYLSPIDQLLSKGVSIYAEPDGSVIAAGFKGEEFSVNAVSGAINWSPAYIYKLNPQHQLEWEVEFHEPFPTMFGSSLTKIIKVSDGTGYLAAGNIHRVISFQPPNADSDGWLVKVSPEGDSLWSRHYRFFEEGVDGETHEIFELKEMPGGGYLMGGQTIYGNEPTGPIQRGWLLRLDEEGCLVPGCHLVSTEEEAAPALSLHLYPNPAQEYLYVLLRDAGIAHRRGAALQLLDLQGRILQSHPAGRIDKVTSILPVRGLPAGAYVLRYVADGQVLAAERVVVR